MSRKRIITVLQIFTKRSKSLKELIMNLRKTSLSHNMGVSFKKYHDHFKIKPDPRAHVYRANFYKTLTVLGLLGNIFRTDTEKLLIHYFIRIK
jgi:hypothetical protein